MIIAFDARRSLFCATFFRNLSDETCRFKFTVNTPATTRDFGYIDTQFQDHHRYERRQVSDLRYIETLDNVHLHWHFRYSLGQHRQVYATLTTLYTRNTEFTCSDAVTRKCVTT